MHQMIALACFFKLIVPLVCADVLLSQQYANETRRIPEIKEGQKCVQGQVYKMDCNTCHCGAGSSLVCTKMGCLNPEDLKKLKGLRASAPEKKGEKRACTPGRMYKMGCKKCFCTEKKGLKCSSADCKLAKEAYINPDHIQTYSPVEFYRLPALPHQGSECQPGITYRIDCNTCLCLANGNLMCQTLLCPSYEDLYRLKIKEISGQPCHSNESIQEDCLQCRCVTDKYVCEPNPVCGHSDGRRMLHGEFPSEHDRNFIDLDRMTDNCTPGMVYKVHCNKCYCQDDGSLRCTQKTCLNFDEVQRLKRLRLKLDMDEGNKADN